jgi:carbonic anhydrase
MSRFARLCSFAVGPTLLLGLVALCPLGAGEVAPAATHAAAPAEHAEDAVSPAQALQRLVDGNTRFVSGHPDHPNQTLARRVEVAAGQKPFAVIVTCSDSRVAPELYFDQGVGDIFVVRVAGHVLNDHVLGSIEYAVEHLHAAVVVVVGHEKCGAVAAALTSDRGEGKIGTLLDAIRPAVRDSRNQAGDKTENAVRSHARRTAKLIPTASPIVKNAISAGHVKVFAARYDLVSGKVELLP